MAKQKKDKKETVQVRVDPDVADMANELAPILKESTPDMLSRILRPLLKRELQQAMERRVKELKGTEK